MGRHSYLAAYFHCPFYYSGLSGYYINMSKYYSLSLFIFRRDLRLADNTALIEAAKNSEKVLPCFIFDPRQIDDQPYRSQHAVQFMLESLEDLSKQLEKKNGKLFIFYDQPEDVIKKLKKDIDIDAVYLNEDYTPFSRKRDKHIKRECEKLKIVWNSFHDTLLHAPDVVLKDDGTPYTVFTPFYKKAQTISVTTPQKFPKVDWYTKKTTNEVNDWQKKFLQESNEELAVRGGRDQALKILKHIEKYKNYKKERDIPADGKTTQLSAYHKFGCVSVREVYARTAAQLGESHELIRQLYWRDFFTQIAYHFPRVFGSAYQEKYDALEWKNDKKKFDAWCEGKTGFPIVDAGMRQLNQTGYMHNRARMIVASFLVKDLHVDWRWGEKYFAQQLIDYDPAVNNGSWQWAASTGTDAQPYFRIFNPWLQQKKFDPDCVYIKKWVPELENISASEIHNLLKKRPLGLADYPAPVVDHKEASHYAKEMFKAV